MASKYVTDTNAAKSVSAYVILKKGKHIATVRAHFSNGGTCLVNVHDDKGGFQHGKAGGYGYDKFTAALRGLTIDGVTLNDHCGQDVRSKRMLKAYTAAPAPIDQKAWDTKARKIGARFANWQRDGDRYTSLHLESGLDKLKTLGYTVLQAI